MNVIFKLSTKKLNPIQHLNISTSQHLNTYKFTLIELLIVMIIVSLAMSTVAPSVHRGYEQQQVMLELSRFKNYLKACSTKAFTRQISWTMTLEKDKCSIPELEQEKVWKYLKFKKQTLFCNKQGYSPDEKIVVIFPNGREVDVKIPFSLRPFENRKEAVID